MLVLLCLCQLLILYKHTHTYFACAFAHTHIETMMGREAHRGSGRKNERTSEANERKQEKITSYINAQDDCYAVCINDRIYSEKIFVSLRRFFRIIKK